MGKIFINYRRKDNPLGAQQVCDKLASVFGREVIFMDIDNIPEGSNFVGCLEAALCECNVMLTIIGASWLGFLQVRQKTGNTDHVFDEIHAALNRGIPIIPVLLEPSTMPEEFELPKELSQLSQCAAIELRSGRDLYGDLQRLADATRHWMARRRDLCDVFICYVAEEMCLFVTWRRTRLPSPIHFTSI